MCEHRHTMCECKTKIKEMKKLLKRAAERIEGYVSDCTDGLGKDSFAEEIYTFLEENQ